MRKILLFIADLFHVSLTDNTERKIVTIVISDQEVNGDLIVQGNLKVHGTLKVNGNIISNL